MFSDQRKTDQFSVFFGSIFSCNTERLFSYCSLLIAPFFKKVSSNSFCFSYNCKLSMLFLDRFCYRLLFTLFCVRCQDEIEDGFGRHKEQADQNGKRGVRKDVGRVIGDAVQVGRSHVVVGREAPEGKDAGQERGDQAERRPDERAKGKAETGVQPGVSEYSRKTDTGKSDGIVEEELRRV